MRRAAIVRGPTKSLTLVWFDILACQEGVQNVSLDHKCVDYNFTCEEGHFMSFSLLFVPRWPLLSGVDFSVRKCVKTAAILFRSPRAFPISVWANLRRDLRIFTHKFTPLSSINGIVLMVFWDCSRLSLNDWTILFSK